MLFRIAPLSVKSRLPLTSSTVKNADKIIVVTHDGIKESGTHEELLRLGGVYAGLYNSQFAAV